MITSHEIKSDNYNLSKAFQRHGKQLQSLPYEELPNDLYFDKNIVDLSKWTLVVSDRCLTKLSHRFKGNTFSLLNLSGGSKITDAGIKLLSRSLLNLTTIILQNVFLMTEKGLEEIVKCFENIEKLELSGCLGISGNGFAILGQHSRNIKSLKLSGCRQVSQWSFMKIFEGCGQLEDIDVSYCSLFTDQELSILAKNCGRLKLINVRECCQISDVGIISLAQRCNELLSIDLARSDLASRITDVSLMAIGESCKVLQSINLSGCSKVSDVGISWLATGCKHLIFLNLTNCSCVTNGAMRYIGNECINLKTLILVNVKKISDVGIRHIAVGCNQLETLNVSGLYKISDGVKRDFALEGIQSLGSAKCTKHLKKLNFHGCFQISIWALKAFTNMISLEHLILSGCTQLTLTGMRVVATSCPNISYLSFASCGDCIDNAIVKIMTDNLKFLRTLILSDCCKISRFALEGISKCKYITNLTLSGCKGINNEAIFALCDSSHKLGLKELLIDRCPRVDDSALLWIVDSLRLESDLGTGFVSLTTLSMKGTKISFSSAKAIRERFRYSSLKVNDAFFGFWPLSRTKDREVMDLHSSVAASATKIQATLRGLKERARVAKKREIYLATKKATIIAAIWRGRATRKFVKNQKYELWLQRNAVTTIQCFFRCYLANIQVQRLREKRWILVAPFAATKIQKIFRGTKGREVAVKAKMDHINNLHIQLCSSIKLQSIVRRSLAIRHKKRLQREKEDLQKLQNLCCIKIQTNVRIKIAALQLSNLQMQYHYQKKKEFAAAFCILRYFRTLQFRSNIDKRVQDTSNLNSKASLIQRWYKDIRKIIRQKETEKLIHEHLCEQSAILIENSWRKKSAVILLMQLKQKHADYEALKCKKAITLTSWFRVCLAKKLLCKLRSDHVEYLKLRFKVETDAATQISSCWRGHQGRLKARSALDTKKSRWKKMWSDEDGRYFFYNQVTGESRWRMPQDLLDLQPKIICSNCDYFEAMLECAGCCEYFCGSCWDAVHFGGKRKSHRFRSLYDFYDRRVDYGDDEYPSIWPSALEQDEKFGLQLTEDWENTT